MEQFFMLMVLLGGFTFMSFGISAALSIEARESKLVETFCVIMTVLGAISFFIGVVGSVMIMFI